ncbi:MAG TPA: glycosyltransferase [Pyrinomonadaceae bacterium]
MNVLHMIDSFEQGGTERQAIQLVRLLQASGRCQMRLACLQNRGLLRRDADRLNLGEIQEYPLTSFYDVNFIKQVRSLARFLKENKIDVVHTHCFYTNIFGMMAAALARVPARVAYKGETDGFRTAKQKWVERAAFRLAHRVVANSEAVRRQLINEGVPPAKVSVHYNGLDFERVRIDSGLRREDALALLGLPSNRRLVTIVANLRHPVKDHPMFLRAAARVRQAVPDAGFVIAGEGELMNGLRELAAQLGVEEDVFFIGRCERVAELLFASDVCVLSSRAEGFSNSILEYMAAARPVVVTDVGGAREAVVEGETGYIVPAGDEEGMAARIIDLLRDPQAAAVMGERGKRRVEERFSSPRHVANTLDLYSEILGSAKSGGEAEEFATLNPSSGPSAPSTP